SCSGRVNTRNICYPNKRSIYHLLLLIVYNITKIRKGEDIVWQKKENNYEWGSGRHSIAVKHDSTPNVDRLRGKNTHKEDANSYSIIISICIRNDQERCVNI